MRQAPARAINDAAADDGAAPGVADPGGAEAGMRLDTLGPPETDARFARRDVRSRHLPRMLVAADVLALTLAWPLARFLSDPRSPFDPSYVVFLLILVPCWTAVAAAMGLYRGEVERADHGTADDAAGIFKLVTLAAWLALGVPHAFGAATPAVDLMFVWWALALGLLMFGRALTRRWAWRGGQQRQRTLIVGAGDVGQLVCRKFIRHPEYGVEIVGMIDRAPRIRRADLPDDISILGGPAEVPEIVVRLGIERVVIAFTDEPASVLLSLVRDLRALEVHIDLVPRLFDVIGPQVAVYGVEGLPVLALPARRRRPAVRALKRAIDVVVSAAALVALAPVMAYIAVRIRRGADGPVLFRQTRLGQGMKEFTALKFRTMAVGTDSAAHRDYIVRSMSGDTTVESNGIFKLDRSDAVTKVGRWLRKTSLDELPQLFNVLRGDMSLVGPRPCIPYEAATFAPHHLERFDVPQGLTGLWQVTARANSTYLEALDLDLAYVGSWSLGLDLKLLARTPVELVRQRVSTA